MKVSVDEILGFLNYLFLENHDGFTLQIVTYDLFKSPTLFTPK